MALSRLAPARSLMAPSLLARPLSTSSPVESHHCLILFNVWIDSSVVSLGLRVPLVNDICHLRCLQPQLATHTFLVQDADLQLIWYVFSLVYDNIP